MKLGVESNETPSVVSLQDSPVQQQKLESSLNAALAPKRSNKALVWKVVAGVCAVAVIGAIGYQFMPKPAAGSGGAASSAAQTVTVTTAKLQDVSDVLTVTGPISAWDPLNVGAEIGGLRITQVNVEEGDHVKRGQALASLNSALLDAQLREARAKLASARAALNKAMQPNRVEQILALKATLAQSEADVAQQQALRSEAIIRLKDAEINAKRATYLEKEGATSAVDTEAKVLAESVARQEVASSEAKLNAARAVAEQNKQKLLEAQHGGRTEDVQISQSDLIQIEAQISHLEEQIKQTVVRSPDDGVIAKRMAHLGETSAVGSPLFSIIRMNKLELQAQVADLDLRRFAPGQVVLISSGTEDTQPIKGNVRLVSAQVDNASRAGTVRIDVPSDAGLKPGMFVKGEVNLGHHKAIVLPPQAVVHRNGESFVFLVHGDRGDRAAVKVGMETDKFVEITDGLPNGETVVAQGARFLSDHDLLRIAQ